MLNELIIASFCASTSMVPGNVCNPTSEAITKQFGVYQNLDMAESKTKEIVLKKAPGSAEKIIILGAAAYKISEGKEAKIGFKVPDFCDRMELGGSKHSGSVMLKWNFK